jgi:carboxypeptidase family protein
MRTFKEGSPINGFFLFQVLVLLFLFSLVHSAAAQTLTTGQVLGRLTDPSGAFVPQAKIQLRDSATGSVRVTATDEAGQYTFSQVTPGIYSVTATAGGFAQAVVSSVTVEVGKSTTINIDLKLGKATDVVEVRSTPGADLQTLDSTVGNTVGSNELLALPTIERSTTSLLLLQPLAMPQQSTSTSQASRFGGQVAGARSDQNSFLLDGGEITDPTSGNTDYWKAFSGSPEGSIPTPVESIQEFNVETNNPSGPLSLGGGAHVVLVTKRGTDSYHGSLYEYYRGAALNANRWDANRIGRERPNIVDNRFGASVGGHVLPDIWKSYFYVHYEGRRRSDAAFITRLVPTSTMRQGILRFKDSGGNTVSYPLQPGNVSSLCGTTGTASCDPRNLGMAATMSQLWALMPPGNDTTQGDGLNTIGFSGFARFPLNTNLGIIRFDHTFSPKLQWTVSYRHYTEDAGISRQVDIGGILGNDVRGVPKILSTIPRQPRYLVTGVTSNFTQSLTNDVRLSWLRDYWQWISLAPFAQLPSTTPAALVPGGDNVNTQLVPVNIDTQGARTRLWNSHGLDLRDDASWLKGKHLLRFGGSFKHTWAYFQRDDGQQNNQKTLQYFLGTVSNLGGLTIPASSRPPTCTATVTTNCLPTSQTANWNNLYAQVLGLVDGASILRARDAGLNLLPLGTDLKETVRYDQTTLYTQDSWRLGSTFTLTFGLAWEASIPPVEDSEKFMMTADSSGNLIFPRTYLDQRRQAALAGQIFNPPVGFVPIGKTGRKYPFDFVKDNFSPRVSAAWQPNFASGILGTLFGKGKSALRGGYWHFYDRLNGVQTAIDPLQAVGFGQALLCQGPGLNAATAVDCRGSSGVNPSTAFRIGIDGSTITLPALASTLSTPVVPGTTASVPSASATIPFVPNSFLQDPQWRPGSHNQWDFTIQREMPGNGRIEVGYVGHTANNIYMGIDLNQVPFFMTAGGQTFAQAFDAVAQELKAGSAVTPQAFFETALTGSAKFCGGSFTSCTAGVVNSFSSAFTNQQARNVFNGIQSAFKLGPATQAATQFTNFFYWSSVARSNYNAGFVSYRVRAYHGLTLDANVSYGHSLDNTGVNQDTDRAFTNSYNPDYDYGTSVFDRKFVFTALGVWQVPFHSQIGWLNRVVGGWQVAPIVGIYSGLPLRVLDGSGQEFGQTSLGEVSEAIRISSGNTGAGRHNVTTTAGCGSSSNPATGGTGLNIFADPGAVCALFRPIQLSTDTTSRGGTLRGLGAWSMDVSFVKKIRLTEKAGVTFSSEFFNLFNHVNFLDPATSLQSPQTFGVLTTQANDPRQVQLGLRFDF